MPTWCAKATDGSYGDGRVLAFLFRLPFMFMFMCSFAFMLPCTFAFALAGLAVGLGELVTVAFVFVLVLVLVVVLHDVHNTVNAISNRTKSVRCIVSSCH